MLLNNYSIYSTYTGKCVGIILVRFLLSYSLYLILPLDLYSLPRTYTVYLGQYGFPLGQYGFHLGQYGFHFGSIQLNWSEAQSCEIALHGILI